MRRPGWMLFLLALSLWAAARAGALAAESAAGKPPEGAIQMKEVEIRGEIERPEVFYIIPRREVRMELAPLSKDYRPEIMEPLLPGPFEESLSKRPRP